MNRQRGFVLYMAAAIVLLVAVIALLWMRLDKVAEERDKAELALKQVNTNDKIVTKVVTELVKVPGPTVVRERLVRVCDAASVPGAGLPDAAAGTDSVDRRTDLAGDIGAAKRNQLRCAALIEVLRPQIE